MQHTRISPREPEAFTGEIEAIREEAYPILEWHNETMQSIMEAIDNIKPNRKRSDHHVPENS